VGRDTEHLDEEGVVRAAVESVAENTVDGVSGPLFFAVVGGPVAAMAYRAASTLDSTFGYKNERYQEFGWASARLDDAANLIPARLTGPLMCLVAGLLYRRGRQSLHVLARDKGNHASPNAGRAEAAMAGALGIQLGGASTYAGVAAYKPTLGDPGGPLTAHHIVQANRLMWVACGLFLTLSLVLRAGFLQLIDFWKGAA